MTQERARRRYRQDGTRLDGLLPAVRVTEAELQWTQDQARLAGQSLTEYVRAAVFARNQIVAESDREHWLQHMVAKTVEDQWGMTVTAEDLSIVRASFNAAVQLPAGPCETPTASDVPGCPGRPITV
jgi:hypothetical protein